MRATVASHFPPWENRDHALCGKRMPSSRSSARWVSCRRRLSAMRANMLFTTVAALANCTTLGPSRVLKVKVRGDELPVQYAPGEFVENQGVRV